MEDYFTHRNSAHRFWINKVDDSGELQLVDADGMADEKFTKIMRVYPHGFNSHALKDSHMVGLGLGGRRDMLVALGGEHPEKRIKNLTEGQSVLYDHEGNVVFMKGNGITVNAKKGVIEIESKKDKIYVKPGDGKNVYLGGTGEDGHYARVMTEDGPAKNVYAKVG